jgi:hypothetical protein
MMVRWIGLTQCLAAIYVAVGVVSHFWPVPHGDLVARVTFWSALIGSGLTPLFAVPEFLLGCLMIHAWPRGVAVRGWRHALVRLALLDFASRHGSTRFVFIQLPVLIGLLYGMTFFVGWLRPVLVFPIVLWLNEISGVIIRLTPPLALYLGPSKAPDAVESATMIAAVLPTKRVVTIMEAGEGDPGGAFARSVSYRTHDDMWTDILDELIEVTPIVIIDVRAHSEIVRFELERVIGKGCGFKSILLLRSDGTSASSDLIALVIELKGVCALGFGSLVQLLHMFSHPAMALPEPRRPIQVLVHDLRELNPNVNLSVLP